MIAMRIMSLEFGNVSATGKMLTEMPECLSGLSGFSLKNSSPKGAPSLIDV